MSNHPAPKESPTRSPSPAGSPAAPPPVLGGGLAATMDRIGWTRSHWLVAAMVLAGMFFDALEQDTTGAVSEGLKASFGMNTADLAFLNTIMILGGLVGRLATGYLADIKGRRFALAFNLLLYTLGGLLSAVATSELILQLSRFIVGVGLGGEFTVGLTLVAEIVATKYRGTVAASLNIGSGGVGNFVAFGLFFVVLGPLNEVLGGTDTSWRWLYVMLALPAVLIVFIRRYMPESPRYLLSRGRVEEANAALTVLASGKLSRKTRTFLSPRTSPTPTSPRPRRTRPVRAFGHRAFAAPHRRDRAGVLDVLRRADHPARPDADDLVSQGYSISDSLLFTMVMNFGSLLGACAAAFLAGRVPRKVVVITAAFLGCLAAIAFASFAHGVGLILVLGATFQFFALLLNTTLAAWSPEIYPTNVRALGTSIVNGIGNVSGAVMPLIAVPVFLAWGVGGVFLMLAIMYVLSLSPPSSPPKPTAGHWKTSTPRTRPSPSADSPPPCPTPGKNVNK